MHSGWHLVAHSLLHERHFQEGHPVSLQDKALCWLLLWCGLMAYLFTWLEWSEFHLWDRVACHPKLCVLIDAINLSYSCSFQGHWCKGAFPAMDFLGLVDEHQLAWTLFSYSDSCLVVITAVRWKLFCGPHYGQVLIPQQVHNGSHVLLQHAGHPAEP